MKYLSTPQQRWLAYSAGALSLMMMTGGCGLILSNPQLTSREQLQSVHAAGRYRLSATVPHTDMKARALGMGLALAGLGVGTFGLFVADKEPASLTPETVNKALLPDGQSALVMPPDDEVLLELRRRLSYLLTQYGWLKSCLRSYCVILVGPSGSGKSTVANAIAVLRALLWDWETAILDPHGDKNLSYGTWSLGKLYGSTQFSALPIAEQIRLGWERVSQLYEPFKQDKSKRQTIIVDEFTGWADGSEVEGLADLCPKILSHALRKARGWGTAPIILLHGTEKGTAGGVDTASGVLRNLLKVSAVVEIEGEPDEFGEIKWSGKARFNKPAMPFSEENLEAVTLPELIYPGKLNEQLGEILELLGLKLDEDPLDEVILKGKVKEMDDALKQRFDSAEFQAFLEAVYEGPTAPSNDDSDNKYPTPLWSQIRQDEDAIKLLNYLKRNGIRQTDIATLKSNWGRHNDVNSKAGISHILQVLNMHHIGEWIDSEHTQWRVLPIWEEFPEWID